MHLPHAGLKTTPGIALGKDHDNSVGNIRSTTCEPRGAQLQGSLGGHSFLRSETREVRLRSGEALVQCGDPLIGLVTVRSGRLKRYRLYQSELFLVGIVAPGETAGLKEMLDLKTKHLETLEAVGETIVVIEASRSVQAWLNSVPPFVIAALRGAIAQPDIETRLKRPIELLPVRARVAATLWVLAARHGRVETARDATRDTTSDVVRGSGVGTASGALVFTGACTGERNEPIRIIDLNLTREEIAHLAGTVYESVIRTLTGLKKEGVIDLQGRVIRILQEDQLARIGHVLADHSVFGENDLGESHDQNTVVKNHNPSNNGSS